MTTFEDSLQTGAGNAYKWDAVGAKVVGTVTARNIVNRPNFDGVPEDVPVIQIVDDSGTEWDLWLGKPAQRRALFQALARNGQGTKLEVGGKLAIVRVADGAITKVGHSPQHLFEAQYQPPTAAPAAATPDTGDATASDLFG